jgi:recombination protein RecR
MTSLDKLIAYFEKFPGVGVRQARRFAFHILTLNKANVTEMAELITSLPQSVTECENCHRFFSDTNYKSTTTCSICGDTNRDKQKLLVVARDSDIQAIERSNLYDGLYFVLGGTIPLLNDYDNAKKLRGGALKALVTDRAESGLQEIILAFSINPDGENTSRYIEGLLKELIETHDFKVSHLGRGLSTGSELEYADAETIKSALKSRV